MREIRLSGSVEGVMGNHDSYSDSGLVTPEEQDGGSARIEGVEDAVRPTAVLDSEFSHVAMSRGSDTRAERVGKLRPFILQQPDHRSDRLLLHVRQRLPPGSKLIGILDRP
jgi:hypothetical protein